jgi:hypothetical protein
LPLALENSSLYSPLALVILGGLVSSTLLTRIVTPVVYMLLAPQVDAGPETRAVAVASPGAEAQASRTSFIPWSRNQLHP